MKKILFLFIFLSSIAYAHLILDDDKDIYNNFSISYIEDKNNSSIQDISKLDFNNKTTSNFSLGYLNETIWFKLELANNTKKTNFILNLNETFYEKVTLFEKKDKLWDIQEGGFLSKSNNSNTFKINIPLNTTKVYFIKLKSKYSKFGRFSIYEFDKFYNQKNINKNILYLFCFGVLFIILIFSIFLTLTLKDNIYKYYLGYIFFFSLYLINLSGFLGYLGLGQYTYKIQSLSLLVVTFLIYFSINLLEIKKYLPKTSKLLKLVAFCSFIIIPLYIIYYTPWNKLGNILSLITFITLLLSSLYIYIKINKSIKYYIFAISLYFIFIIIFLLMIADKLPYNNITRYGYIVASIIEIIIFSLMLVNRYNNIRDHALSVQKELLDIKNKNEIFLEKEVNNRTKELEEKTKEIKEAYFKVKGLSKERELLLREIHHRVKNNFQIIISIIWFESKKPSKNFLGLISRIKSMSTIHDFLYNSKNLSNINISEYLDKIIQNLVVIYEKEDLEIKKQITSINVDFNTSISLGIIVNEVLSNAIKHHHKRDKCLISISIEQKQKMILLKIQDNGDGFCLEENNNSGIGLNLIKDFTKKLNKSDYSFSFDKGTIFQLKFQNQIISSKNEYEFNLNKT